MSITFERSEDELLLILTPERIDIQDILEILRKDEEWHISRTFMQCNDPSSLLRELLLQIYNEQKSFENVSDIMFVYNSMYNSNFLNIRNECIHGRDYLAGGKLRYAFRVTLLCIYMVMFRIDTIEEKVSDLID